MFCQVAFDGMPLNAIPSGPDPFQLYGRICKCQEPVRIKALHTEPTVERVEADHLWISGFLTYPTLRHHGIRAATADPEPRNAKRLNPEGMFIARIGLPRFCAKAPIPSRQVQTEIAIPL